MTPRKPLTTDEIARLEAGNRIADALIKCGWTPHQGDPCPVDENSYPIVLLADGSMDSERASDFDWEWSDQQYPSSWVIAYRKEEIA